MSEFVNVEGDRRHLPVCRRSIPVVRVHAMVVAGLLLGVLLVPKIALFGNEGGQAVRADDLLTALVGAVMIPFVGRFANEPIRNLVLFAYLSILLWWTMSGLHGFWSGDLGPGFILYPMKMSFLVIYYFACFHVARHLWSKSLIVVVLWAVTIGSYAGVVSEWASAGYEFGQRFSGPLSGPWELGLFGAVISCVALHLRSWPLVAMGFLLVVLSGSRVNGVAVVMVGSLLWLARFGRMRFLVGLAFACGVMGTLLMVLLLARNNPFVEVSSGSLDPLSRIESFAASIGRIDWSERHRVPVMTSQEYMAYTHEGWEDMIQQDTGDDSFALRLFRWDVLLQNVDYRDLGWMKGLGPSYAGLACDSFWIRAYVEGGLLGVAAYVGFLALLVKQGWGADRQGLSSWLGGRAQGHIVLALLAIMLLNSFFIDIYLGSRAMLLLAMIMAYSRVFPSSPSLGDFTGPRKVSCAIY